MKKEVFKIGIIAFAFLLLLLFSSCGTQKKIQTTEKTTTSKVETSTDKNNKVETSEEIKDRIIVNVPESSNEATMKMVDAVLKQLNTSKVSGNNSYASKYNEETRQLVIDYIVGETQNKTNETVSNTKTELTFDQQVDSYIKKKVIPWWMYAIAIFLLWPHIKWILNLIPGVGQILARKS